MEKENKFEKFTDDNELKRLIWEEWEGEIKEEDPREMVFKYMKLMRDEIKTNCRELKYSEKDIYKAIQNDRMELRQQNCFQVAQLPKIKINIEPYKI